MKSRELEVADAWEFTPVQFPDDRGLFLNWFVRDAVEQAVGHSFQVEMTNHSVSRKDVVRGVHYALVPPSQAKYVYCPRGAFLDILVDIRVGSPTFGKVDTVRLDTVDYRGVYVAEGLGHAAVALEEDSVLCYLCSTGYDPGREKGLTPLDPALGLQLPADPVLSAKDRAAPTLEQAREQGLLPHYEACQKLYDSLR